MSGIFISQWNPHYKVCYISRFLRTIRVFFPGDDSFVVLNFSYASCPASEYAFAEPFYIIWLHEPIEQQVGPVTALPVLRKTPSRRISPHCSPTCTLNLSPQLFCIIPLPTSTTADNFADTSIAQLHPLHPPPYIDPHSRWPPSFVSLPPPLPNRS